MSDHTKAKAEPNPVPLDQPRDPVDDYDDPNSMEGSYRPEFANKTLDPVDPRNAFTVEIVMHTDDAHKFLDSPETVRHRIGFGIESNSELEEEIDYTLTVSRSVAAPPAPSVNEMPSAEQWLARIGYSDSRPHSAPAIARLLENYATLLLAVLAKADQAPRETVEELTKLRAFYEEVANLTVGHDVIGDSAVVYPSHLGKALEKVNPKWW